MTTQTKRVYLPLTSLRPEACFEVTRTDHPNGPEYAVELVSGDVDCDSLEDAEDAAIELAKAEWAEKAELAAAAASPGQALRAYMRAG